MDRSFAWEGIASLIAWTHFKASCPLLAAFIRRSALTENSGRTMEEETVELLIRGGKERYGHGIFHNDNVIGLNEILNALASYHGICVKEYRLREVVRK